MKSVIGRILVAMLSVACALDASAKQDVHVNPATGLKTWSLEQDGLHIEFIQLLPDFVRAIYGKHGFPPEEIERIADVCVFGTISRNTADAVLSYKVDDWSYVPTDGDARQVKSKDVWIEEWRAKGITFSWTLLPSVADFEVGDWQQGFTTIGLGRSEVFDLTLRWTVDGEAFTGTIEDMRCAPADVEIYTLEP